MNEKILTLLRSKRFEYLYFAVFSLLVFKIFIYFLNYIGPPSAFLFLKIGVSNICRVGVCILLFRKAYLYLQEAIIFFKSKENKTEFLTDTLTNLFFFFGMILFFLSIRDNLLNLIIVWLCSEISYDRIQKIHFPTQLISILIWLVLYAVGYAGDVVCEFNYAVCHSFGMKNPNTSAIYLTITFFTFAYLYWKRNRLLVSGIGIILIFTDWSAFGCRTQMVVLFVTLLLLWISPLYDKLGSKLQKTVNILFFLMPIILLFVSMILGVIIDHFNIDEMVSNTNFIARFQEFVLGYRQIGLSLIRPDQSKATMRLYFDNLYIGTIFADGILPLCWMLCLMLKTNRRIIEENDKIIAAIAISCYLMFLMEKPKYLLLYILGCYANAKKETSVPSPSTDQTIQKV